MTFDRMERWVKVSYKFASLYPVNSAEQFGSVITIQKLARFEHDIDVLEEEYRSKRSQGLSEVPGELDRITTYSYLWVLGAYEIIRTLAQKTQHALHIKTRDEFARLRIPLAKLEPSKKHASSDFAFPEPVFFSASHEVGWTLNPNLVMTRKQLSEALLESLEKS